MPVSFAEFHKQTRSLTIESELGPVVWAYYPYKMTLAREAEINRLALDVQQKADALQVVVRAQAEAAAKGDEAAAAKVEEAATQMAALLDQAQEALAMQFCELVARTDMIGPLHAKIDPITMEGIGEPIVPDGETVPIRLETVRCFSSRYIKEIFEAITVDARPKEKTPTP